MPRVCVALSFALAGVCAARADAATSSWVAPKLDPGLLPAALGSGEEPVSVWVTFLDKGERSPGELAARLAAAEASLSPRARARRIRARVRPLVDYRDVPVHPPYLQSLEAQGFALYGVSRWFNRVAVRTTGARLGELAALPYVERILPVERMWRSRDPELLGPPVPAPNTRSVTGTSVNYGQTAQQLAQIQVPALHDSGYNGAGVLVCVLDEGFNYFDKHEALRDQPIPLERQRDFIRGVQTVQDTTNGNSFNHGTWCLGLIAGNKLGTYVGAAYGAQFALARTEYRLSETPQEMVNWGLGAEWADSLGADIISSSLGYFTFDDPFPDYTYADMNGRTTTVSRAAEVAASKGILVVNSVGNEGGSPWHYLIAPSDVDGDSLVAVGAVDANGNVVSFSSYGPSADGRVKPDVAARGSGNPLVSSFGAPDAYTSGGGTSFSCPLIAGLAACLMQARPTWTPRDVARALRSTASRASSPNDRIGYGIANGAAALAYDPTLSVPGGRIGAPRLTLGGPNPLRGGDEAVRFALGLGPGADVSSAHFAIFDISGRRVRDVWSGRLAPNSFINALWDGQDDDGRDAPRGLYFASLEAGGERATERVVVLR